LDTVEVSAESCAAPESLAALSAVSYNKLKEAQT
jgi:hypothetical protein